MKYEALGQFLRSQGRERVPMTFAEIERVTGAKLPRSQRYPAWWSNNTSNNVMTKVWLDAGYRSEQVDVERKCLVFRRVSAKAEPRYGMEEQKRAFVRGEGAAQQASRPARHPIFGALEGTFTIEPGYDLTRPVYSDAEWNEIVEAKLKKYDVLSGGEGSQ